jgi:hypothetical protein
VVTEDAFLPARRKVSSRPRARQGRFMAGQAVLPDRIPSPAKRGQARPGFSGAGLAKAAAPFARDGRRGQGIVTVTGGEAIPLATTTSVLLPAGVRGGMVNWVVDVVPGATDTEDQLKVRA